VHKHHGHRPFSHRRSASLHRSVPHVARGEYPWDARLQVIRRAVQLPNLRPLAVLEQVRTRVAVLGIGGLRHLAVQYAKAAGFETIAVSHSPDKDKMIRDLSADEIVRDGKSLAAAGGADVILSTSNSTKAMVVAQFGG
jgi:NADPH:quinone reductase-like Zn-dependent oxidoreductase